MEYGKLSAYAYNSTGWSSFKCQ